MLSHEDTRKGALTPEEWNRVTESLLSLSSELTKSAGQQASASEKPKQKVAVAGGQIE